MRARQASSWTACTFALVLALAAAIPAGAQPSATEMFERVLEDQNVPVDPQLTNAVKAVEDGVKAYATNGNTQGGASGTIGTLLTQSDRLICQGWLISFYDAMRDLSIESGGLSTPGSLDLYNSMRQLANRIEMACQKVLNTDDIGGGGGGGGGGEEGGGGGSGGGSGGGPSGPVPDIPCPGCEDERRAYERAHRAFVRAEHELLKAHSQLQLIEQLWQSNPAQAAKFFDTPSGAARAEDRKREEWRDAQRRMNDRKAEWLRCVSACHEELRKQYGFFDDNKNKFLAAAAAVVATTATFIGIGGDPPPAIVNTPASAPIANTPAPGPTPVTTAPAPAPERPTLLSLLLGRWACSSCRASNDPDRHENTLGFCAQLIAAFLFSANSPLRIEHPAPWITTTGELDEASATYRGTGMGSLSRFSGVSSTVLATFQRSGDAVTGADLVVTLGENGVFPGGRPATYAIRLTKMP